MFMFERNKGERRRVGAPAPEMCQRSLVPPGPEHQPGTTSVGGGGVCGAAFKAGRGKSRGKRNPKRLRVVTNVTPGDKCQTPGSQPVRCAAWCKYTTAAYLAGVWFPWGEAELGKLGTWRTQSVTKSREAISCTPALPSVTTNETLVPPFATLLGGTAFPGISHSPGLSAALPPRAAPHKQHSQLGVQSEGFLKELPKGNQTLKCRLNADTLCRPTNLLLQATDDCIN